MNVTSETCQISMFASLAWSTVASKKEVPRFESGALLCGVCMSAWLLSGFLQQSKHMQRVWLA